MNLQGIELVLFSNFYYILKQKKVMNVNAISLLGFTTIILITLTIFVAINLSFSWVFFLTVLGQALLVFTVYKVLRDDYQTDKTFNDFYEDRPDLGRK